MTLVDIEQIHPHPPKTYWVWTRASIWESRSLRFVVPAAAIAELRHALLKLQNSYIASALVTNRVHNCNYVRRSMAGGDMERLQWIQNTPARVVSRSHPCNTTENNNNDKIEQCWSKILGEEKHHDKTAEWINEEQKKMGDQPRPE